MMSWPATAVVAYLYFFPSDVLSPVQMLKQAWMLFHTVFNTTKERNQEMMGNEKGHTGYKLECGACTNKHYENCTDKFCRVPTDVYGG